MEIGDPAEVILADPDGTAYARLKTFAEGEVDASLLAVLP